MMSRHHPSQDAVSWDVKLKRTTTPRTRGVAVPSCSQPSAAPGDFCSGNGGIGRQAGSGVGAGAAVTLRCNVTGCCCSWGPGEFMRIDSEVREII